MSTAAAISGSIPVLDARWSGRDTFTVEEAGCEILGLSRCSAYEFARTGVIPTIRIGKRLIVPRVGLERLLTGMAGA
jgi:hypothetical protein